VTLIPTYQFAYSLREKTHASHKFEDNVPEEEKLRRLQEVSKFYIRQHTMSSLQIISSFRSNVQINNDKLVGRLKLVLVEGQSKKSTLEKPELTGRSDSNHRCILDDVLVPEFDNDGLFICCITLLECLKICIVGSLDHNSSFKIEHGDYVVVEVIKASGTTLRTRPLGITKAEKFHAKKGISQYSF
jgi:hypothetical protein